MAADPSARLRDIAATVGITERTATDLVNVPGIAITWWAT
jgi:hypothetical protein